MSLFFSRTLSPLHAYKNHSFSPLNLAYSFTSRWAAGVDRLAEMLSSTPTAPPKVFIVAVNLTQNSEIDLHCLSLSQTLRTSLGENARVGILTGKAVNKLTRLASKEGAAVAVFVGDNELADKTVTVKSMDTGDSTVVPVENISDAVSSALSLS